MRIHGREYQRWLNDIRSYYDRYLKLINMYPATFSEIRAGQDSMSKIWADIQHANSEFGQLLDKEFTSAVSASIPKANSRRTTSEEMQADDVNYYSKPRQPAIDINQFLRMYERRSYLDKAESGLSRMRELLLLYHTAEDQDLVRAAGQNLDEARQLIDQLKKTSVKVHEHETAEVILKLLGHLDSIVRETDDKKRRLHSMEMEAKATRDEIIRLFEEFVRRLENQKTENEEISTMVTSDSSIVVYISILGIAFFVSLAVVLWAGLGGRRQTDLNAGNELSNGMPQVETDKITQTALDLLIGQLRAMVVSLESIRRRITGQ